MRHLLISKKTKIKLAYRLMLGREPENTEVIKAKLKLDFDDLRAEFVHSYEFRLINRPVMTPCLQKDAEVPVSNQKAEEDFSQLVRQWTLLGENDPYWSVLSSDEYSGVMSQHEVEKFYQTGNEIVARYFDLANSVGIDLNLDQTVLELGCGVGRITKSLSEKFLKVIALDISPGNIEMAKRNLTAISNVEFIQVSSLETITELPRFGHLVSVITLQHNPPHIQDAILRILLSKVSTAGGLAFFQTVTNISKNHQNTNQNLEIENQFSTYAFPMDKVLSILRSLDFELLQIYRDDFQLDPDFHSYSFFARRK
jgi:2-polyprenyl-3-methyl-5-hydroxy-6-metoxy-1,4-benzoquinol methylase